MTCGATGVERREPHAGAGGGTGTEWGEERRSEVAAALFVQVLRGVRRLGGGLGEMGGAFGGSLMLRMNSVVL